MCVFNWNPSILRPATDWSKQATNRRHYYHVIHHRLRPINPFAPGFIFVLLLKPLQIYAFQRVAQSNNLSFLARKCQFPRFNSRFSLPSWINPTMPLLQNYTPTATAINDSDAAGIVEIRRWGCRLYVSRTKPESSKFPKWFLLGPWPGKITCPSSLLFTRILNKWNEASNYRNVAGNY